MGVLDEMTKGITDRKAAATGPKLTPVGLEASGTKPSLALPQDTGLFMSNEALHVHAQSLRAFSADAIAIAEGIDLMVAAAVGKSVPVLDPKVVAAAELKVAEKLSDEKAKGRDFAKDFAKLQAEAEAAVYTSSDAVAEEPAAPAAPAGDGWVCPTHGADTIKQLRSRKGREYAACQTAGCGQFERE